MGKVTGYLLRLTPERLQRFLTEQGISETFAEPVEEFQHSRNVPLVCFICDEDNNALSLALGRRGMAAGTGLRRLNLSHIQQLEFPVRLVEFLKFIPPRVRWRVRQKMKEGGIFTPKQFEALADAISENEHELGPLLERYSSWRANRIKRLPEAAKRELAYQKEAVGTALGIAGFDRTTLQEWDPPEDGIPTSFLDGLPQTRLREDPMVEHDAINVPGYSLVRQHITGAAIFEGRDGSSLTVVMANRQPLEKLTGADLIYYNERFQSFVMVQYKAMEKTSAGESVFRLPNEQLEKEIARMDHILAILQEVSTVSTHSGFRLSWNPFFLKLCPRIVFNPDDVALTKGMYIPLDKWKLLESSDTIVGKHGGRGVTFKNVERHLDNTAFITLVSQAWVGTTPQQSTPIREAIRNTLESGRAAVLAIHTGNAAVLNGTSS